MGNAGVEEVARDAIGLAFEIREQIGHAHAVAALDTTGRVCDFTAFTADEDTIDTALGWFG